MSAWSLLAADGYIPHGHCYLWQPGLILLQVSSNLLIGLAYVAISSTLAYLVWRVRDIPFQWMYMAFGVFIISCGVTHLMDVWTVWTPLYWLDGGIRAVTAAASVLTALLLPALVPQAVALAQAARTAHERGIALETAYKDLDSLYSRQRELDRAKTSFFANVSHELRTPLALIIAPVEELLSRPDLAPVVKQDLVLVRRNAHLLLANVDDLLGLARSEAGRLAAHPEPIDLAALTRGVTEQFAEVAQRSDVQLRCEIPASLPVMADGAHLERILLNLLSNAFKFVPQGGMVRVTLATRPEAGGLGAPAESVVLEVADDGPGVPEAEREQIFERFYQGGAAQTRRLGGTGLGLAIVRDLVTLHHGTVTVTDAPEGGALFRMVMPWQRPAADTPLVTQASSATAWQVRQQVVELGKPAARLARGNGRLGRVLVVEDNVDMNDFLARILTSEYEVDQVFDGAEGLQFAVGRPYDLVVTDLMMPGLSGEQLIEQFRLRRNLDTVPILVLTAKADEETRVRLLQGGAQDFILKPFNPEELVARVRRIVTVKRARDLLQQELSTQIADMEQLALEVSERRDALEQALAIMREARNEAERANLAKSTFLTLVSHELRTPLTTLKLHLNLLAKDPSLTAVQQTRLQRITMACDRLLRLVQTVLTYTRIQSGRLVVAMEAIDVAALIEEVAAELQVHAGQKGVRLEVDRPLPQITATSDPALLRIVLANLVENAIKYTSQGLVRVSLHQDAGSLSLVVCDTGPGIPAEDLSRVFKPFEQVGSIRQKSVPGVGLGLTIVRDLVAALHGQIRVESEVGQGSTFTATVPLEPPAAERAA